TEQLADKQSEIQALKHLLDGQTVISSRFEQLTCDFEHKCSELSELQARYDELSSCSVVTQEIEQKTQSLEQLQTDLTNREASLANA
ncbi:hypothetical protein, partial [Klebsiella aerogenes]|uniref:hypothetical protein n=1 Tax=Klebsiella aerogenes TaxID=548 RepID=UPI001CC65F84